jgi:hypothetical protein
VIWWLQTEEDTLQVKCHLWWKRNRLTVCQKQIVVTSVWPEQRLSDRINTHTVRDALCLGFNLLLAMEIHCWFCGVVCVTFLNWDWAGCHGGKAPDLRSGGARFESRPGHQLYFHGFTQFLQVNTGIVPWLDHNRFIPSPYQLIIHLPSYHCTLYNLNIHTVAEKPANNLINWVMLYVGVLQLAPRSLKYSLPYRFPDWNCV